MAITVTQKLNNGYAYKIRPGTINIRSAPDPTDSKNVIGTFPSGNFHFYYTEAQQSTASSNDYFVKIASGQNYTVGWVACSSGGTDYIYYTSGQYSGCYTPYYTTETSGYADADYYWPNAGSTSYSYQTYSRRYEPGFYLLSSPGSNTISNTKTNIVLTINYNNDSTNGSKTGQTWTETTYNFAGWDRATSAPSSITSGKVDHEDGDYRESLNDENFYAVYTKGNTSDPKYSNNTVTLTSPTKNEDKETYKVTFDANGGTVSTKTTSVTKTTIYRFNKWSGSTGVTISGTTCTFKQTGIVTANYTSTTTEAKVSSMPTPTRVGYKFLGWGTSTSQSSGLLQPGDSSPAIESNITYYAIWDYDGSVRLYYNNTDKYKIALIWMYYPTSTSDPKPWKLVIPYMKTDTNWKITAG